MAEAKEKSIHELKVDFVHFGHPRWQCTSINTAQKMNFPVKDFFSKCVQRHRSLWIWRHLPDRDKLRAQRA